MSNRRISNDEWHLFEIRRSKFIIRHSHLFNIHHFLSCQITHSRPSPCPRPAFFKCRMMNRRISNVEWLSVRNSAFEIHHSSFTLFEIRRSKFIIRHSLSCQITHSRPAPWPRRLAPDRPFLNIEWWTAEYRMSNDICSKFDVRYSSFVIPTCSIFIISFLAKSQIHALHHAPCTLTTQLHKPSLPGFRFFLRHPVLLCQQYSHLYRNR